jgi:NACHT domain
VDVFLTWLVVGGIGPAGVGVPVTWAASMLAEKSRRWFQWVRRSDDLSRIVRAATDGHVDLTRAEFDAIRDLLGQESTWDNLGQDGVEHLASRIAKCLEEEDEGESRRAGGAIAAGLLEFVVGDLEPEWFQRVVFARLARLEGLQGGAASALDKAMSDLATLVASRETDDNRIRQISEQLGLVLERLQPRRAGCREVMIYLGVLIQSLKFDPWPADNRFPRPALTAADVERKLKADNDDADGRDLDADELGRECSRLVVLGGPGAGKTWLAKRTARLCAEKALDMLASGTDPGEVELPLYTTCARLASVPPDKAIRSAVVASAFAGLRDLGSVRVGKAVGELFEERNTATLLVIDSLDETQDPHGRVSQAGTLPTAWRIMLTSRPGSWHGQLAVLKKDEVFLQPLRYPEDIEPFVQVWFDDQPDRAAALMTEFDDRLDLQEMGTVPLLLTFCCIIGGDQPLPGRRTELYEKVVRRMLTGWWRGDGRDPENSLGDCLDTLYGWAWGAASSDPISGIGDWQDEFCTLPVEKQRIREALDHVAVPMGRQDLDTHKTRRRFVHRSVQEYLTARKVSRMSAREAADALLGHVWYDRDWEYAAPSALAMHRDRGQVLRYLVHDMAGVDLAAFEFGVIDRCWEFRKFLARVANESSQTDWQPEEAKLIGQARMDIVLSGRGLPDFTSADWPTTNRLILEHLRNDRYQGGLYMVPKLALGEEERAVIRQELLRNLVGANDGWRAAALGKVIAELGPTAEERTATRQELLRNLVGTGNDEGGTDLEEAIAKLSPTSADRTVARQELLRSLVDTSDGGDAAVLAKTIVRLGPTADEYAVTRQELVRNLTDDDNDEGSVVLGKAIAELGPTANERAVTRQRLLRILTGINRYWEAMGWGETTVLGEMIAEMEPTLAERTVTRQELLRVLTTTKRRWKVPGLEDAIAKLGPTADERGAARQELLRILGGPGSRWEAADLEKAIVKLSPTADERAEARRGLLCILARVGFDMMAAGLGDAIAKLGPTADERAVTRQYLLRNLLGTGSRSEADTLRETIAKLAVGAEERAVTRQELLQALPRVNDHWWKAVLLWETVTELGPTAEERTAARQELLHNLRSPHSHWRDEFLVDLIAKLAVGAEERAITRQELLRILRIPNKYPWAVNYLGMAIAKLSPTSAERAVTRQELLRQARANDNWPMVLGEVIAELDATAEERSAVRQRLLSQVPATDDVDLAAKLCAVIAELSVTVTDIGDSRAWPVPPTPRLMMSARRNSALGDWLAALPVISDYPRHAEPDNALTRSRC